MTLNGGFTNVAQHSAEHEFVKWKQRIPINDPEQANRIEYRCLANGAFLIFFGDLELKPRSTGDFHFSRQAEDLIVDDLFDSPKVQRVANTDLIRVASAAADTNSTSQLIHESADLPKKISVVPTSLPSDTSNRHERLCGRQIDSSSS